MSREEYIYPYIADKKMYAAVMGACKWIRESGYFNKAVSYYADKYDVDADELAKHIRERQSAGRKFKSKGKPPRKYKYFVAVTYLWCEADTEPNFRARIVKGVSEEAVKSRICKELLAKNRANDYGGCWSLVESLDSIKGFGTEEEAMAFLKENNYE